MVARYLLVLLFVAGCGSEDLPDPHIPGLANVALLVVPTWVAADQDFSVTWEVVLDSEYRTGLVYDMESHAPDIGLYEFATFTYDSNEGHSYTIDLTSFSEGNIYVRPYVVRGELIMYGDEVEIPIDRN